MRSRDPESRSTGEATPRRDFAWGFVSQSASSLTNLGLSLLAARTLGPRGLGIVFLGFSYYLIALGFERALITDPLVAASAALDHQARMRSVRICLPVVFAFVGVATIVLAVLAALLSGPMSSGLVLFVPWLAAALLQDFWRSVLFRDQRGGAAASNDFSWLVVMGMSAPIALAVGSSWSVTACWGLGGLAGSIYGFVQVRSGAGSLREGLMWWRKQIWPLARWLSAASIIFHIGSRLLVFLLPAIIGTTALGGLRAVQVLFAPVTLIGPAFMLPGLPLISRGVAVSVEQGRSYAVRLGVIATSLTAAYLIVALLTLDPLMRWIFGSGFQRFAHLVWPVGVGQLLVAPTTAFGFTLTAERRTRTLLTVQLAGSVMMLAVGIGLAKAYGVSGAAWGMSIGAALQGVFTMVAVYRDRFGAARSGAHEGVPHPVREVVGEGSDALASESAHGAIAEHRGRDE